jgi:O-antigen/teichoic acid export membrane protein
VFKDIIGTIGARYLVAFLNLLLIFINSKALGTERLGVVGLILVASNFALIFNNLFCGNTIVYFIKRYNIVYVFYPAYFWAFAGSFLSWAVMYQTGIMPEGYEMIVLSFAIISSLNSANSKLLLGDDKVKAFNFMHIIQGLSQFIILMIIYFVFKQETVDGYITGLYLAYFSAYLYSFIILLPKLYFNKKLTVKFSFFKVLKEMFVYGVWSSLDNLAEGLTMRLNYFIIQSTSGYSNVGLLDTGTRISESVWHISSSISFIEYNSVSKTTDRQEQKRVTLKLFKLTFYMLILVVGVIVLIPEWVFDYLLSPEFKGIRKVILALSAGMVAFGGNRIIGHYFIGSGQVRISTVCSFLGLVLILIAGSVLIPCYGIIGAAASASIAYSGMLLFSLVVFICQTNTKLKEFIPVKDDIVELKSKLRLGQKN